MILTAAHPGLHDHLPDIDPGGVYIAGMGAQTPIGRSALASSAAVRCGISAYAEHPYMIDQHGEPMIVCRADWLDVDLPWAERLASLADEAAVQAWESVDRVHAHSCRIGLHVAVGDPPPDRPRADEVTLQAIRHRLGPMASDRVQVHVGGHAAGLAALHAAYTELCSGQINMAMVGGTDSFIDSEYLEAIDHSGRLHSVNYSWGITPGEAAAFLLLVDGETAARLANRPLGRLVGVGVAQESKTMGTKTVCIGEGLTAAYKQALGTGAFGKIQHAYCDMNGETYRGDEFGFAVLRTRRFFDDAGSFTTPADCWGDVGAASGPLLLTLPLCAWARGYGQGDTNLVWCSSASLPGRGAAVVVDLCPRGCPR